MWPDPNRFADGEVKPGTPVIEHFKDIAARLKELEAERQRETQAANVPEEKK